MSSPSRADARTERVAVIGCGALTPDLQARFGPLTQIHPLPPLLHNRPERIADAVRAKHAELAGQVDRIVIGYADCGTYGAIDDLCAELGLERLPGRHCYDLYAGPEALDALMEEEPGTYVLTDFLVASFDRTVWRELGLHRHPELRDDYFRHYRRVVWLAGRRTPDLERAAERAAERLGLPLEVREIRVPDDRPSEDSANAFPGLAYD